MYKQYQNLNKDTFKSELYNQQLKIIRPILTKENNPVILIINWRKNILKKDGSLYYSALLYNLSNGERKLFRTSEENPKGLIVTEDLSNPHFKELVFVLNNYINEKEEYLLSLHNSFSDSEMNTPYYIYDFTKNKKLKINSFFFDKEGKIIQ